jgi:hypothetical protein
MLLDSYLYLFLFIFNSCFSPLVHLYKFQSTMDYTSMCEEFVLLTMSEFYIGTEF